ncbi:DEAD/DEAH box helicase domain-containing protein [Ditylenchus destructor]|nr:DEAD/DEAH box helicase domain-containing protein [Ditylenchus destructor]
MSYNGNNGFGGSSRWGGNGGSNGSTNGYNSRFANPANGGGGGFGGGYGGDRFSSMGSKLKPTNFNTANLPPLRKGCYKEHENITRLSTEEILTWLGNNDVTLEGENLPRPIFQFNDSTYPQPIIDLLHKHYEKPTVIQSISWPVALSGRDMTSIAKTGSGKTLGFTLPAIVHTLIQEHQPGNGPVVLVMLPTRELAQQVEEVAREYCKAMNLKLACLFGGSPKPPQARALREGIDICVATPGRLSDFLEEGTTNMDRCSFLVLDEADRMLDMGFEPQIRKIVSQIRPDRQSLMFSATWPRDVRKLALDFQKQPVFLNVGSMELSANHNIEQIIEIIQEDNKQKRLADLLTWIGQQPECKTLIFVQTKRLCDSLTYAMRKAGYPVKCIHGDKAQPERDSVLNEFREGTTLILLATDVAARGLDVHDIKYVINYHYPKNSEDYVHRIGRTGRRDQKGTSFTFFDPRADRMKAKDLIKVMEEAKQNVPAELANLANGMGDSGYNGNSRGGYGGGGYGGGGYGARRY